jgi:hypothetical protein
MTILNEQTDSAPEKAKKAGKQRMLMEGNSSIDSLRQDFFSLIDTDA